MFLTHISFPKSLIPSLEQLELQIESQLSIHIQFQKDQGKSWDELWGMEERKRITEAQREVENKINYQKLREIQPYCNQHMYTDAHPYEVVKIISNKCVEIRLMDAEMTVAPKEFHPGGFCGRWSDNRAQEYSYKSNPENPVKRVRWSEANKQWQIGKHDRYRMSNHPYKFHDFNF